MTDIRIRQVENGYIVFDTPKERHMTTENEFVFETFNGLCVHLKDCFENGEEKQ